MTTAEILEKVAREVSVCTKCDLHLSRKLAVPGAGSPDTDILFIGEGPGFHENEQGLPFVGRSGQFLDELLASCGMSRETVFITNVVKCRPPGNRDPLPPELAACNPYLERQIAAINPKVIVTLGRWSMAKFIPNAKISAIHGQPRWVHGRMIVPMYHPAAALRLGSLRAVMKEDFSKLPRWIAEAKAAAPQVRPSNSGEENVEKAPEQLDIFGLRPAAPEPHSPSDEGRDGRRETDGPEQLTLF